MGLLVALLGLFITNFRESTDKKNTNTYSSSSERGQAISVVKGNIYINNGISSE